MASPAGLSKGISRRISRKRGIRERTKEKSRNKKKRRQEKKIVDDRRDTEERPEDGGRQSLDGRGRGSRKERTGPLCAREGTAEDRFAQVRGKIEAHFAQNVVFVHHFAQRRIGLFGRFCATGE